MWGLLLGAGRGVYLGDQAGDRVYRRAFEVDGRAVAAEIHQARRFADDDHRGADDQRLHIPERSGRPERLRDLSGSAESVQELAVLAGEFEKSRRVEPGGSKVPRH